MKSAEKFAKVFYRKWVTCDEIVEAIEARDAEHVKEAERWREWAIKAQDELNPALARIRKLEVALRFVVNRRDLMFAECADAEEILKTCENALNKDCSVCLGSGDDYCEPGGDCEACYGTGVVPSA